MLWGHTATWWGIVLSIVAIVLIVPGAVVSNFITVIMQNKIAQWLQSAPAKRLAVLQAQLTELEESGEALTDVEEQALRGIVCACKLLTFGIRVFGAIVMLFAVLILKVGPLGERNTIVGFFISISLICYFVPLVWEKWAINGLGTFIRKRSRRGREYLKKEIEDWKRRGREQGQNL
jgi:hypothetical protein